MAAEKEMAAGEGKEMAAGEGSLGIRFRAGVGLVCVWSGRGGKAGGGVVGGGFRKMSWGVL
jgi:hypothetical protein